MNENELYHHGVLGMKWGKRKDRTKSASSSKRQKEKNIKKQVAEVKKARRKAVDRMVLMSDKELDARIKRLSKEKQLKQLTSEEISPGRKFVKDQMSNVGNQTVRTVTSFALGIGLAAAKKQMGLK